jgi:hypothetical protein
VRPYPDDILRSMRHSVDTYLVPNLTDRWALYVARSMKRMLVHLERRFDLEGDLLVEDSRDLQRLLAGLGEGLPAELAGQLADLDTDYPREFVRVATLAGDNERLRDLLDRAIRSLPADARYDGVRADIRACLRRQMERDVQLAEPTFVSFAPPPVPAAAGTPS